MRQNAPPSEEAPEEDPRVEEEHAVADLPEGQVEEQEDGRHLRLPPARAERLLHVQLVVVQQAQVELAVGGEAHAVAGAAVGLAHRGDEADDTATAPPEAVVARLLRRVLVRDRGERAEGLLDAAARLGIAVFAIVLVTFSIVFYAAFTVVLQEDLDIDPGLTNVQAADAALSAAIVATACV